MRFTTELATLVVMACAGIFVLCSTASVQANEDIQEKMWWDRPKLSIAYGGIGGPNEPINGFELMRLSGVSAIVGGTSDELAQRAAENGINLIGLGYAWGIPHSIPSCRSAANEKGQISTAACPFSEPFWEGTIRKPVMDTVRRSLKYSNVVGFFVDSEQYAIYPRMILCFCYDCWEQFLVYKGIENPDIKPSERAKWLARNGYLHGKDSEDLETWIEEPKAPFFGEYVKWVEDRLTEQYKALAEEAHALNPKFVFGKLPEGSKYWYTIGMARGVATDESPFFVMLEGTYASEPSYGKNPERGGWSPQYNYDDVKSGLDPLNIPYRMIGGTWLTVNSKEKADKRYTRDVFQLYDQAHRLGSPADADGYWFGPVGQIIIRNSFRKNYPGCDIRQYWLALRSVNRLLGIKVPEDEQDVLDYLRKIDD